MDGDIILFKNPFPYLFNITDKDLIAQGYRCGVLCSGFMYFKSTNNTIALMTTAHIIASKHTDADDQYAIHLARRETVVPTLLLSLIFFQLGRIFSVIISSIGI